jgi:threonine/homoserine/homoserine lactone efflux protein
MTPSLTFLIAALVLAVTPGPGIAYVVARTVAGGRSEGVASCVGTGVGGMVHVLAAALGLSALLAQSATAFSLVKFLGAAYLIYMGVRMLLDTRNTGAQRAAGTDADSSANGARRAFRDGIIVEAMNVKTAIFFLAFLPQFVITTEPVMPQLVLMGTICVFLNTLVDLVAVFGAARLLASSTARAAREKLMLRASGCTMIGLGVYLATAKRGADSA